MRVGDTYDRSWSANGLGLASGVSWADSSSTLLASAGYCDPWWGEGHLRAHLAATRRVDGWLRAEMRAWRNEGVAFVPRLEGDGEALLTQGLLLPGWEPADAAAQRQRDQLSCDLVASGERGVRGRLVFSLGGLLFKNDLDWEGRLMCVARGAWQTPYGRLPARARLDGEIHATIGAAHLFLALRNVTNAEQESATYADGLWAPLMLRSYQAGFEWRFRD